jgi:hypothetical protein
MKLVGNLLKYTAMTVAGLLLCFGLWLASLLWHSPDYAAIGTCTTADIARTEAEIKATNSLRMATYGRVLYETWTFHPHLRTLQSALQRAVNLQADYWFSHKRTSAYLCNHALRHVEGRPADTLPQLVSLLAPYEADENARWRLALCMTYRGRNIDADHPFEAVRAGCAIKQKV